jgi:hypothetical protein
MQGREVSLKLHQDKQHAKNGLTFSLITHTNIYIYIFIFFFFFFSRSFTTIHFIPPMGNAGVTHTTVVRVFSVLLL